MQAVVHWKAALQLILMKNTESHNNEYFDNLLKMNMDVSKFYHGDYYLEELKTIEGK